MESMARSSSSSTLNEPSVSMWNTNAPGTSSTLTSFPGNRSEIVVELVGKFDFPVGCLDNPAEDPRLVVVELAEVALDRDALEVAVADGDAALMFGVLLTGVEHCVGLELQSLSLLQLDDRDIVVGDLDERVPRSRCRRSTPSPDPRRRARE